MLAKLLLLATLALTQGRPSTDNFIEVASDDNLCPQDRSHYLLPHEYDCTKFYYCEYGLKWETPRDCAPGTQFSYELQVCVHPVLANCELPGVPPTPSPEEPETESEVPETVETEATTSVPQSTEAIIVTTSTSAPQSTEASIVTTSTTAAPETEATTSAPQSTEASIVTTSTTAAPETEATTSAPETEATTSAPETEATTSAPQSTEASIVTTSTTAAPETEATTSAPQSTEASIVTTSTTAAPETEATTSAPQSTEAAIITTSTTEAPTPEPEEENGDDLPNGCPADWDEHRLLPHETDCDKFYYCVFGEKVERSCAPGTYFNPEIQVCDWPENVECANSNGDGDNGNGEGDNGNGEDDNGNEDSDNENGVELLPNGCPADWEVHQLLPHESDCGKFYYCVFGETVERECAPGLHFNPTLQVCDWPANAGCKLSGGNGDEDSGNGDSDNGNGDGDNGNGEGDNGNGEDDNGNEDSDNGNEEGDNGNEDGDNGNGEGENGNGEGDNGNGEDDNGDEDGDNGNGVELLPNGCPADWDVHQLLPHESDCGKFYYCVFGETVERQCAPGLHFNPTLQVCDWPANAGCELSGGNGDEDSGNGDSDNGNGDGDNGNGEGDNGNGEDDNGNEDGDNGNEDGDNGNEDGDNGNGDGDNGNGEGDNGNGEDDNGNEDGDNGNGVELLPNGCPADWDVHQLLPHESDCGKFYYCVFGETVERECAPGLHFNPTLQVCDWPWNANCESSNGEDGESGSGGDNGSGEGDNGNGEDGNGNGDGDSGNGEGDSGNGDNGSGEGDDGNGDGENGNGDGDNGNGDGDNGNGGDDNGNGENGVELLPNGCPADWDVHQLLPHESDCGKFYYCVFGETVERDCPPGLHFNPIIQVCDWPANAGCELSEGNGDEDSENGDSDNGNGDGDNGNGEGDNGNGEDDNGNEDGDNGNEDGDNGNEDGDNGNGEGDNGNGEDDNGNEDGDNENGVELLPNGCPADWDVHQLLPHESDCGKFYYCVFGETVERDCPPGLHFNPNIQVCDWPANAGCELSEGNGDEDSGNGDSDNGNGDGDNGNGEGDNGNGEDDNGNEDGDNGNEDGDNGNEDGDNGNGEGDNGNGEDDNGNEDGDNENGVELLPNGCPADWDVHQLLPHESDCGKFYYCVFGETVERDCAPGLHFNPTIQVCDWPENAGCELNNGNEDGDNGNEDGDNGNEDGNNGNEDGDNGTEDGDNGNEDGDNGNEDGDNGNEDGDNGNEDGDNGTEDGDNGNEDGNNGNEDGDNGNEDGDNENGVDLLPNGCPADWDVHQLLPHESECGKFYYCVFGETVERECAPGLHFNPTIQVCDWPENAGCELNNGNEDGDNGNEDGDNGNEDGDNGTEDGDNGNEDGDNGNEDGDNGTEDGDNGNEDGDNGNEDGDNENEDGDKPDSSKCANSCNILPWAHKTACDKFWRCEGDKAVLVVCSEGLHFNANTGSCDFICNANCVREYVQTTADARGLKIFVPWDKVDKNTKKVYRR